MTDNIFEDPADTREEILAATYRCLRDRGYADLTMQAIGEELERSPSLVYHHYEDKDALVLACLEYLLDHFEAQFNHGMVEDSCRQLEDHFEWWFGVKQDDEWNAFMTTLLELRTRAVYDPAYREYFTRSDRLLTESVAKAVRGATDSDEDPECDPDAVAETIQTAALGTMLRRSSTNDDTWLAVVRRELERYTDVRIPNTNSDE